LNKFDAAREDEAAAPGIHNQSVLKAVALIGCFVNSPDGKTLTKLARETGLNVSTAYRMLQTLVHTGILRREAVSERFMIGPMLLALAGATFSAGGYGVVQGVLRSIADETGESVSVSIRDGECAAILLAEASSQPFRFVHRAGERVPIHVSAMGKALLAFADAPLVQSASELGPLVPHTPHSITQPARLLEDLERTRRRGYAVSSEEQQIGVRSVAVPIYAGNKLVRAAIGLQAPVSRLSDQRIAKILPRLQTGADLIAKLPFVEQISAR
jgi:DNA-binding IclR family transcriptional regulator